MPIPVPCSSPFPLGGRSWGAGQAASGHKGRRNQGYCGSWSLGIPSFMAVLCVSVVPRGLWELGSALCKSILTSTSPGAVSKAVNLTWLLVLRWSYGFSDAAVWLLGTGKIPGGPGWMPKGLWQPLVLDLNESYTKLCRFIHKPSNDLSENKSGLRIYGQVVLYKHKTG